MLGGGEWTSALRDRVLPWLDRTDWLKARLVLILGKDELQRGEVTFRDLAESSQWTVSLADMMTRVRDFLTSRPYDG